MSIRIKLMVLLFLASFAVTQRSAAQELSFNVRISAPTAQLTDPKVFKSLETAMRDFLNNRKWSEDEFKTEEKIKCNLLLTIDKENANGDFSGTLTIQSSRPIYGSKYETTMINYVDKEFNFSFIESQPLNYSDGIYTDNLTAVLAYYCYLILGFDYDSFEKNGGEIYFKKAQELMRVIPPAAAGNGSGWNQSPRFANRFTIIDNLLNSRNQTYRSAIYTYHRMGLDLMSDNVVEGRKGILSALGDMEKFNSSVSGLSVLTQMFVSAKNIEIVDIFSPAPFEEKQKVYNMMTKFDPSGLQKYVDLNKQ